MNEAWRSIPEFPGYSVSSLGRVQNEDSGRMMTHLVNQQGIVNVSLSKGKVQYKRSLAHLVANAFVDRPSRHFNTAIHLDGDPYNNEVHNILWRPRWFAIKYAQQFYNDQRGFSVPIVEIRTGEEFSTSWVAATKYGLIDREIFVATTNRTYVWPTYQVFMLIK